MPTITQKLLSRKFLLTIAALVTTLTGSGLDSTQLWVTCLVSIAYVLAEAFTDRSTADQQANRLTDGIAQGLAMGRAATAPGQLTEAEVASLRTIVITRTSFPPASPDTLPSVPSK